MKSKLSVPLLSIVVVGCASIDLNRIAPGYIEAYKTIKSTYFEDSKLDITSKTIQNIPYASALLKIGNGSQGLIILESLDDNKETWVSSDELFLVLKNGRIIRTAGIEHNLVNFKSNIDINRNPESNQIYYQYYSYDEPELNDLRISAELRNKGLMKVDLYDQEKELLLIEEHISSEYHGWSFINKFWLDDKGFIIKSKQKISPKLPYFEIEITKKPAK